MRHFKGKVYTAAMTVALFGIVFGGWFLTRRLLEKKEEEFLSSTGTVALHLEQTALLTREEAEEEARAFKKQEIPVELMQEILLLWNYGGKEMPHEPKEEQMNMEQAIETGKQWIAMLAEHEIVPKTLINDDFDKITAQLSTVESQTSLDGRLLGRWTLEFIKDDVDINLTIHAMSGEVWNASISMMAYSSLAYEYNPDELIILMLPRLAKSDTQTVYYSDHQVAKALEGGLVTAEMYVLITGGVMPSYEISFWLNPVGI